MKRLDKQSLRFSALPASLDMDKRFQIFKKDMQRDLFIHIVVSLKHGGISHGLAKSLSQKIIEVFKNTKEAQIYEAFFEISKKHPEIMDIFIKNANAYENRKRMEDIPAIISFIEQNDIENALRVVKGGEN